MSIEFETDELFNDRDYIFKFKYPGVYTHLINISFYIIYIRNDTNRPVKLNQRNRLEKFVNIKKNQYYFIDEDIYNLIILNPNIQTSDYTRPFINSEDVKISFKINIYKNVYLEILNNIVVNYSNLFTEIDRVINIPEN